MSYYLSVLLAFMLAMISCASADEAPLGTWTFLAPGEYHEGEAPLHPGKGWLALVLEQGKWKLIPAKVMATRVHDYTFDALDKETGIRIDTSENGAIALIRHSQIKQGEISIPGADEWNTYISSSDWPRIIMFNGKTYTFSIEQNSLVLKQGSNKSDLGFFDHGGDQSQAYVEFIGDLDRDGALDLITGDEIDGKCLHLSSLATAGSVVERVGCHGYSSGC